jgi:hypothetical protein
MLVSWDHTTRQAAALASAFHESSGWFVVGRGSLLGSGRWWRSVLRWG